MRGDGLLRALPAAPLQRLPRSRVTNSARKPDACDLQPRGQRGAEQSERAGHDGPSPSRDADPGSAIPALSREEWPRSCGSGFDFLTNRNVVACLFRTSFEHTHCPTDRNWEVSMRFIDRQGKEVPNGTKCLAVRNNGDGTSTIYSRSEEDLNALINDMKSSGITGPETTMDYWRTPELLPCAYVVPDGCDAGTCSVGHCQKVVRGDHEYCMCLP